MTYKPRLPPRAHQVEALRRIRKIPSRPADTDVFALLMEMGTGKSKVVVDEWGERAAARDVSDLLIFAPAGCYRNWTVDRGEDELCELHKHLDPAMYERAVTGMWRSGGNQTDRRALEALLGCVDRPRVLAVNVEAISSVDRARAACETFLSGSRRGVMVAVDESTVLRNRDAKRTEFITQLGQHPRVAARRLLTGLPSPRSPMDLYAQFYFLDPRILGFRSYFGFRGRYAVLRKMELAGRPSRQQPMVEVGYKNVAELRDRIAPYSYRVLKKDCLDLPPKQWVTRDVELHPEQRRIYEEVRDDCVSRLASETWVTATMLLTQRIRLDQVLCGHVRDEEGTLREVPELRTDALVRLLADYDGKAIVWCSHDYSIRRIVDRLSREYGPRSTAAFWGGNRGVRGEGEARFKTDRECRFMVASQAAGGRGNTWTVAGLAVYYNNTDDLEHRSQSEDRNHRDGLQLPGGAGRALYVDLVARGTIDERKIKNLRRKIDLSTIVTGDNYREWLI